MLKDLDAIYLSSSLAEIVFYRGAPSLPRQLRRSVSGWPELLHYAPDRYLFTPTVANASGGAESIIAGHDAAIFAVAEKWRPFAALGPEARRRLATDIDVEAMLEDRDCAATTLYDCPVLLARITDGYLIWVAASYVADFLSAASG